MEKEDRKTNGDFCAVFGCSNYRSYTSFAYQFTINTTDGCIAICHFRKGVGRGESEGERWKEGGEREER